jgi:type I restriction enzyme, S subunit
MKFKHYRLDEVCSYSKERINIEEFSKKDYISTENMLPDKRGITIASTLPSVKSVAKYSKGDTLISNIRPYFKKIWYGNKDGGASGDVLIFKPNNKLIDSKFLYYFLSQDKIFDYMVKTSKGTKMPRGDKAALMSFPISLPHLNTQRQIAIFLSNLDLKIELNNKIISNLERLSQTLFKRWFIDFEFPNENGEPYQSSGGKMIESELGLIPEGWEVGTADDMFDFAPKTTLKKGEEAIYVEMKNLEPSAVIKEWSLRKFTGSGSKFRNGDTLLARITPCLENGKIGFVDFLAPGSVGWGSTEFIPIRTKKSISSVFSYFYISYEGFKNYAISNLNGSSGRQRVSAATLASYPTIVPNLDIIKKYTDIIEPIMEKMKMNRNENKRLTSLRDTLIPKLLSGEVEIPTESEELDHVQL